MQLEKLTGNIHSDDSMMLLIVAFKNIYGYAVEKTTYVSM